MNNEMLDQVRQEVDRTTVPLPDLEATLVRGRRLRRRHRAGALVTGVATIGVVVAGGVLLGHDGPTEGAGFATMSVPTMDFTHGLRAYAAPPEVTVPIDGGKGHASGGEIHMGGRSFDFNAAPYLDTDGTATSAGVVFFDSDNRPKLLAESGDVVALGPKPPAMPEAPAPSTTEDENGMLVTTGPRAWHPTAKADSASTKVLLTQPAAGGVEVQVVDVATRTVLARRTVACTVDTCGDVVAEAYDRGTAFVRTPDGTRMWDGADQWELVSGPETRLADVRNHVVLYDESRPAPTLPDGWRAVSGAIDAQLTFDGSHVLDWSSTLAPTREGGSPVVLDKGPKDGKGPAWWTFDTDGSVLVAVPESGSRDSDSSVNLVYDCDATSGACDRLADLTTKSGDPMFVGDDM